MSGCAVSITGAAILSSGFDSNEEDVSCGTMIGGLAAGIAIDATIAATASVTGETFSPVDRFIVGLAAADLVAATVIAIKQCRD
jgi:hypothetical protein